MIGSVTYDRIDSSYLHLKRPMFKVGLLFGIRPYFQLKLQNRKVFPPESQATTL